MDSTQQRLAIEATFARRQLAVPKTTPLGLTDVFALDAAKQTQWVAFQRKNQLEALDLAVVVALLRQEFHRLGITPSGA